MEIDLDHLIEGAAEKYARKHDISARRAEEMLQTIMERVWDGA